MSESFEPPSDISFGPGGNEQDPEGSRTPPSPIHHNARGDEKLDHLQNFLNSPH